MQRCGFQTKTSTHRSKPWKPSKPEDKPRCRSAEPLTPPRLAVAGSGKLRGQNSQRQLEGPRGTRRAASAQDSEAPTRARRRPLAAGEPSFYASSRCVYEPLTAFVLLESWRPSSAKLSRRDGKMRARCHKQYGASLSRFARSYEHNRREISVCWLASVLLR